MMKRQAQDINEPSSHDLSRLSAAPPSDLSDIGDDLKVSTHREAISERAMEAVVGERVGRIITTKDFLPNGDLTFAVRLGVEPRGTQVVLGALRGVVYSTERKKNLYKDKELESIWLNGSFEAVLRGTGEIKTAPTAILPFAFGLTIENTLRAAAAGDDNPPELTIDCDIGLESTGRPIPYEWIVIYYREGKAHKALRDVRARSDARLGNAKGPQKLISGLPSPA
jgi:hypothetical protein